MIVTKRARMLLLISAITTLIGLAKYVAFLTQFGLAMLIWIGIEWAIFCYRTESLARILHGSRHVADRQGGTKLFWKGLPATVTTNLTCRPCLRLLPTTWVTLYDLLPIGTICPTNSTVSETIAIRSGQQQKIEYTVVANTVGSAYFAGLRCILHDQHGFFQAERFIDLSTSIPVLPVYRKLGAPAVNRKRRNTQAPPGIHLSPKAGAGSELLAIREYIPGDPPKSIAWKVSARRGTLMTKQFESEVPVRCQLFIDLSPATRLGYPGHCMANRLIEVATTVSQQLVSQRDAVGLSVFGGAEVQFTQPSSSRRTQLQMMDLLAKCMDASFPVVNAPVDSLIRPAFDIIRIRYPQAVHHAQRIAIGRFFPKSAKRKIRESLAAILAAHYSLDELAMGELVTDDEAMSHWLQRFMSDHHAPYAGSRYDGVGNDLFGDSAKLEQLTRLVTHAVARAKDNELFLVFAELCDLEYDLDPLLSVMRLAVARGHRIAVLCAWPPTLEVSESSELDLTLNPALPEIETRVETRQRMTAFMKLKKECAKLRIPVAVATEQQAISLTTTQLGLVRQGRAMA